MERANRFQVLADGVLRESQWVSGRRGHRKPLSASTVSVRTRENGHEPEHTPAGVRLDQVWKVVGSPL